MCCRLEWPQAVLGGLRRVRALPTAPSGCFGPLPWGRAVRRRSAWLEATAEEWRPIATGDGLKLRLVRRSRQAHQTACKLGTRKGLRERTSKCGLRVDFDQASIDPIRVGRSHHSEGARPIGRARGYTRLSRRPPSNLCFLGKTLACRHDVNASHALAETIHAHVAVARSSRSATLGRN